MGFNYREALVLYDVRYAGRSVLDRASLVEMTVPYAEPRPPFQSKNAGVQLCGCGFTSYPPLYMHHSCAHADRFMSLCSEATWPTMTLILDF